MMLILSVGLAIGFIGIVLLVAASILDRIDGLKARRVTKGIWDREQLIERLVAGGLTMSEATARLDARLEWHRQLEIERGWEHRVRERFSRSDLDGLVRVPPFRCPRCGAATYLRGWAGSIVCTSCDP